MVRSCSAINCKERYIKGSTVSFHSFPSRDARQVRAWCVAMRRKGFHPTVHSALCSKHFTPDSFFQNDCRTRMLKIDAIPTIFDFGGIVTNKAYLKKYPTSIFHKRTQKTYKTKNFQSNESTGFGKKASLKENPTVAEIVKTTSTPRPYKTVNFQSSESTDTGKKVYSVKGKPNVFLIVKTNSTPKLNKTVNFQSNESTDTGKKAYSVKENPRVVEIVKTNSTPKLNKTVNFQSTDTGKKAYSVKENPSAVKIVTTNSSRKNTEEKSGRQLYQEQLVTADDVENDAGVNPTVDKHLKTPSLPSDQFSNTTKEIEFLRETIDHLRKKVKRFKCLTNVLQSYDLISEEAAEVLRSTIEM